MNQHLFEMGVVFLEVVVEEEEVVAFVLVEEFVFIRASFQLFALLGFSFSLEQADSQKVSHPCFFQIYSFPCWLITLN